MTRQTEKVKRKPHLFKYFSNFFRITTKRCGRCRDDKKLQHRKYNTFNLQSQYFFSPASFVVMLHRSITMNTRKLQNAVHVPNCECPCGAVTDYQLKEFKNGTLHVYAYCKSCGTRATSPVKRESIPLTKWKELLIVSGHLTEATHG